MMDFSRALWIICVLILVYGCSAKDESLDAPTSNAPAVSSAEYVGNESCAGCHEDVYASYSKTGMGRSVSLFDASTAPEQFPRGLEVYSERFDYYYTSFVQNDTLFQREYRKDGSGKVIHERVHPVSWVIGSGNATRSYMTNVNGHVTQMPLTWYVDKQVWDLSPAYEQQNFRFERPIGAECMTCHNGLPEHSPFTQNHYEEIPLGISCERCHGPGSEHVDLRLAGLGVEAGEVDETIVNPSHLDRPSQLSVCQQCHLTGTTVLAAGEEMDSFRPGELLSAHRSVFVIEEQLTDPESFGIASHAQRLARSQCFQESDMTCVTCHNPHEPVAALDDDAFNQACIGCHTPAPEAGPIVCSREDVDAPAEAMTGNCVGCHLQKSGTSDIPHVTFTDHWIRRTLPPARLPENIDRDLIRTAPFNLVRIDSEKPEGDPDALLEEAIAYFTFYDTEHRLDDYLPEIAKKGRQGLSGGGEHVEGRLALARALVEMDSLQAARTVFNEAIAMYPDHAMLHFWLGDLHMRLQNNSGAIASFKRATELSPKFLQAKVKLASAYSIAQLLSEAENELLQVVADNPTHLPDAWNNLGFIYLQT
ncbi:MAG: tetratricopeptide repeat protein, partial [Rhodothermales bacterium]